MIKTFYQEDIINRLAALITYGLNNQYSYKSIEEHIVSSLFINDLENGQFNNEIKEAVLAEKTYGVSFNEPLDISFKALFIAESYFKLFIYFNKSFEYLFLYWPLSYFISRYNIYHEMDFSNLRNDFIKKTKEMTLIKKLSKERNIKLIEISKLTGINKNTIDKYARNDQYLYNANYGNIHKLAKLFNVKDNIFLANLGIYFDASIYLFDDYYQDYRNYLGLEFAYYFDKRIDKKDFIYDKEHHLFKSINDIKIKTIVLRTTDININSIKDLLDDKTYLIILITNLFIKESDFLFLKQIEAYEICVITPLNLYLLKKNNKKEITETINDSLMALAFNNLKKTNEI